MNSVDEGPTSHVFILTCGRTGSTLLQGILNSYSNVRINGENHGALYYLYRAYRALRALPSDSRPPTHPFFGADNLRNADVLGTIEASAHKIVLAGRDQEQIVGFKEVRYDIPDLNEFVDWMDNTFTNAKFILLTRASEDILKSGFWKNVPADQARKAIAFVNAEFESLRLARPEQTFSIEYPDLTAMSPKLMRLIQWLGLRYEQAQMRQVLALPHSYDVVSARFFEDSSLQLVETPETNEHLEYWFLDNNNVSRGQRKISGVIVPRSNANVPVRVEFIEPNSEIAATTIAADKRSPGAAKLLPHSLNAANARFTLEMPDEEGYYHLVAVLPEHRIKLGSLVIASPGSGRTTFDK